MARISVSGSIRVTAKDKVRIAARVSVKVRVKHTASIRVKFRARAGLRHTDSVRFRESVLCRAWDTARGHSAQCYCRSCVSMREKVRASARVRWKDTVGVCVRDQVLNRS